jgi:molybdopterin/thiamine biosynthesis adenylyltransferase/rhodanese-related sulfurtransferase
MTMYQATADVSARAVLGGTSLTAEELTRYSRHLSLPGVGIAGQQRLKAGRVLVIGLGGLGSPVAMYLAAAGVGHLGFVDFDEVDVSNLQRQIVHGTSDVGRAKLDSAADRVADINPHVNISKYDTRLTADNALEILRGYDVVIDGTDNFATRYLTNDACVLLGIPNVYGSIFRFDGQASVLAAPGGPCYRCVYPEPPPPGMVPNCAEGGVFGVLPGIVGTIQATDAIKIILGVGEPLIGRLLLIDALTMAFRTLQLRADPQCPLCGTRTIRTLVDYEQFCGAPSVADTAAQLPSMSAIELATRLKAGNRLQLIDVREPFEWEIARIDGARLVPLSTLEAAVSTISRDCDIVVHCKAGTRSAQAVRQLIAHGFTRVWDLTGGIASWSDTVDSRVPKY